MGFIVGEGLLEHAAEDAENPEGNDCVTDDLESISHRGGVGDDRGRGIGLGFGTRRTSEGESRCRN